MPNAEKTHFKQRLKQLGEAIIQKRIAAAKTAIENAQQAANSEEKSSVGDKYETARAMSHLDKEMHTRQLAEHLNDLAILHSVNVDTIHKTITTGSFVRCETVSFFVALGLGKQVIDGSTVLFVSPKAPVAKILHDKSTGDEILINGTPMIIQEVY